MGEERFLGFAPQAKVVEGRWPREGTGVECAYQVSLHDFYKGNGCDDFRMPRSLRIEYEGAVYHVHVMSRGDRREAIFRNSADRERFLQTLDEACGKTEWQVHALCLMSNHFHLVIETPGGNLVAGMKWLLGIYTSRFNRRHKFVGHLFSGRF